MSDVRLTFGRHIGCTPAEVVAADESYALWLLAQRWFKAKHGALYADLRRVLVKRLAGAIEEDRRRAERDSQPGRERFRVQSVGEFMREAAALDLV